MTLPKEYTFFVVVLTKHNKLVDSYVTASSQVKALDKLIDQHDLAGMVKDFKICKVTLE